MAVGCNKYTPQGQRHVIQAVVKALVILLSSVNISCISQSTKLFYTGHGNYLDG